MPEPGKPFSILLYHAIDPREMHREKYAVGLGEFEKQLEYLRSNDFAPHTLSGFFGTQEENQDEYRGRKGIVLSFDDGSLSDYTLALPLLLRFGYEAVFFVTTDRIGTPGYMNWEQLQELADRGMSVQSHGLSHSYLSEIAEAQMVRELSESKKVLEKRLRRPVDFFSLPGGFGSSRVMETAKRTGFRGVCTSEPGMNSLPSGDQGFRVLKRFLVSRQTSAGSFQAIVEGKRKTIMASRAEDRFKMVAKKLMGAQRYRRLWMKYFQYLHRS